MPFSSSPELDDGAVSDAGVSLEPGGRTQNAARQAQIEAMRHAQASEVAIRQQAIEIGAREYASAQEELRKQEADVIARRTAERELMKSHFCSIVIFGVVVVLGYLAWKSYRNQQVRHHQKQNYGGGSEEESN